MTNRLLRCVLCMIVISSYAVRASAQNNGGVPVRIKDEPEPACINATTDRVYLTLYRVIESKQKGFLTKENTAELVITVNVQSSPKPKGDPLSFPVSTKVDISPYSSGQISVPIEYPVVSAFTLKGSDDSNKPVLYTGFSVVTTLINLKSKNGLGAALQALSDITSNGKQLSIPDNPYMTGANYLLGIANKAIQNDIDTKNARDKYTSSALALNFSLSGDCSGTGQTGHGFEKTGTKAVLMATGTRGDGYVPVNDAGDYCWAADLEPAFSLKAARAIPGKSCADPSYESQFRRVTNDYIAYFLQKETPAGGNLGPDTGQQMDKQNAQTLCNILKVKNCLAAQR